VNAGGSHAECAATLLPVVMDSLIHLTGSDRTMPSYGNGPTSTSAHRPGLQATYQRVDRNEKPLTTMLSLYSLHLLADIKWRIAAGLLTYSTQ